LAHLLLALRESLGVRNCQARRLQLPTGPHRGPLNHPLYGLSAPWTALHTTLRLRAQNTTALTLWNMKTGLRRPVK
jgi:hypothetical protein